MRLPCPLRCLDLILAPYQIILSSVNLRRLIEISIFIALSCAVVHADEGVHPLSIEALRERKYSAGTITFLNSVPALEGLEAREFQYESDGNTVYGLIEKPIGKAPPGGWPVILLAHGYIPPNLYSTTKNYRLVTQYYAAGGFFVVKPDYRGHGRSTNRSRSPARTVDYTVDVMNLIAGLKMISDVDSENIFLYGHSMGGEIGLRIMTISNDLKGSTLWAPVTRDFPENTLYFLRKRNYKEAAQRLELINTEIPPEAHASITPNNYLDSINTPLIIHHGSADESVPFNWSQPFRQRLDAAGVPYTFYEYPGENHNISKSFYKVMTIDMEFFRNLM